MISYSEDVVKAVLSYIRAGNTRYKAAKRYGVSGSQVSKWCAAEGMTFSHQRINESGESRVVYLSK